MVTPSNEGVTRGHPVYIIFLGLGSIKDSLGGYGMIFDAEVDDDTLHCMIVDPRFSTSDVEAYIVSLGGTIYVPPEEE